MLQALRTRMIRYHDAEDSGWIQLQLVDSVLFFLYLTFIGPFPQLSYVLFIPPLFSTRCSSILSGFRSFWSIMYVIYVSLRNSKNKCMTIKPREIARIR
jgi:hypothetical protein